MNNNDNEELNSKELNNKKLDNNELNSDKLSSDELNSDELNSDKLSSDELNSDELNSDKLSSDELNIEYISNDDSSEEELIDYFDDEDDTFAPDHTGKTDNAVYRDDNESDKKDPGSSGNKKPKRKRTFFDYIRFVIMIAAGSVFLYSAFMLGKIFLEYKKGEDIYKTINSTVLTPVDDTANNTEGDGEAPIQLPFKYDHQALLGINPDGVGYLYVPSIDVRLPIVQGADNDYYLTHTFNRVYNGSGALFEDYRITGGLKTTNVIIYGHNMKNGSMFAGLTKYLTPSFYQISGNDVFYIYTENKLLEYKIFSAYISEPVSTTYTFNFTTTSALREYAKSMKELSCFNSGVDVSNATQVVTFSTCTGDGSQRIIVHGTLIGETPLQ